MKQFKLDFIDRRLKKEDFFDCNVVFIEYAPRGSAWFKYHKIPNYKVSSYVLDIPLSIIHNKKVYVDKRAYD